ncbi:MAG TPA: SpoIID/LytB domain-containing protein [Solirubrobacteraceae bacterium]|nr:SpoIID/LytB domain-containing protein [Solirubrobacteraceae bacterium]
MRRYVSLIGVVVALGAASTARAATTLEIRGGGDGHGIGMSQYGAYGYAAHGQSYEFILAHYYEGTALGNTDPNQVVRVLLGTGKPQFSGASDAGGHNLDPSVTYSVGALPAGGLALYSPAGKKLAEFSTTLSVTGPGPLTLAGRGQYRGALEFRAAGSRVQMVNAVGLDDYVRGVISAEMPASWPPAALEAQAVAARTYAITTDVAGNGYQLYDDTRSQMYGGVAAETPPTDAAVAATSGQIVTYQGNPAITYFFSSSGGHTENIENVWLGATPEPWLRGVPDPYDAAGGNPYYRWSVRLSIAAADKKLGRLVRGRLRGIRLIKRGVSPRVVYAQVMGTRGTTQVTGPQLQSVFGLLSTYMRFTTISARTIRRRTVAHMSTQSWALRTLVGSVFPARPRTKVTIEVRRADRWRRLMRVAVGPGAQYRADVPDTGTYRVVYGGVIGPTVSLP